MEPCGSGFTREEASPGNLYEWHGLRPCSRVNPLPQRGKFHADFSDFVSNGCPVHSLGNLLLPVSNAVTFPEQTPVSSLLAMRRIVGGRSL